MSCRSRRARCTGSAPAAPWPPRAGRQRAGQAAPRRLVEGPPRQPARRRSPPAHLEIAGREPRRRTDPWSCLLYGVLRSNAARSCVVERARCATGSPNRMPSDVLCRAPGDKRQESEPRTIGRGAGSRLFFESHARARVNLKVSDRQFGISKASRPRKPRFVAWEAPTAGQDSPRNALGTGRLTGPGRGTIGA